jgi:hypothetical protein
MDAFLNKQKYCNSQNYNEKSGLRGKYHEEIVAYIIQTSYVIIDDFGKKMKRLISEGKLKENENE